MLTTEWNLEDAKSVWYEEGREEGWEAGLETGKLEIARNLLAKGSSLEFTQKITGLSIEEIEKL